MKQKNIFIAFAALLILALIAGAYFYTNQKNEKAAQMIAQNSEALARPHSPTFGDAAAPVHIVEFLDPACGTCRDFYPMVKNLMAANPGKIRVSIRYAPFHQGSDQVVRILEAARKQAKFRQALEALFVAQADWVRNHKAQVDAVWRNLDGLDLDMDRLKSDMNSPEIAQIIEQDLADAKTLNVTMTPEFVVNGKPLPSFGFEQLKTLVDEALVGSSGK